MPTSRKRVWLGRVLWVLVPLALLGGLVAFLAWPRHEILYTDGRQTWPARPGLGLRTVLWDAGDLLQTLGDLGECYDPCLSPDGQELYFTCGRAGADANLFVAYRTAGGWTGPKPIAEINTDADEIGPALAPDSATLYFFSNRPGGEGGYDLYVSRHDGTRWSKPANLGPRVNSPFNEYDPFVTPDGQSLLFASNRPTEEDQPLPEHAWPATLREQRRLYDYDLYALDLAAEAAQPRRLDAVSGPANDGQPATSPDGRWLYFASDRPGGLGGFDLWRARITLAPLNAILPPENVGEPVNSAANELDPAVSLEGFGLFFSSDRDKPDTYAIYYARSHEVYQILQTRRLALGPILGRLSWPLIGLILALVGLALTLLALLKLRKRPGLLAGAMIASLILHLLALSLFTLWQLSVGVYELAKSEERFEVAVSIPGLAESELSAELRTALVNLARLDTARFAAEKTKTLTAPPEPAVNGPAVALAEPEPVPQEIKILPPEERPAELAEALKPESAPAPIPELAPPEPLETVKPREARTVEPPERLPAMPLALAPRLEIPAVREAPAPKPAVAERMEAAPALRPIEPPPQPAAPTPVAPAIAVQAPTLVAVETPAVLDVAPVKTELAVRPVRTAAEPSREVSVRPLAADRPEAPSAEPAAAAAAPIPAAPPVAPVVEGPPAALPVETRAAAPPPAAVIEETPAAGAAVAAADVFNMLPPAAGPVAPREPRPASNGKTEIQPPIGALPAVTRPEGPVAPASAPRVQGPAVAPEVRAAESAVGPNLVEAPAAPAAPPAARILVLPGAEPVTRAIAPPVAGAPVPLDLEPRAAVAAARKVRGPAAPAEAAPRESLVAAHAAPTSGPAPEAAPIAPAAPLPARRAEPAEKTLLASTAPAGPKVGAPTIGETVRLAVAPPAASVQADISPPPEPLPLKEIYTLRTQPDREKTIEKLGGTPETEEAVRLALVWVTRHQSPDGHWDIRDFANNYDENGRRADGPGNRERQNLDVTGLTLLSLIGAGHTHLPAKGAQGPSPYAENVQKAVDWIIAGQESNGDLRRGGQMYGQAMATMALCELYTMTGDARLVEPTRKAVQFIIDAQNPDLGWRYEPRSSNDTSVVGWQIMALKSAEIAGFDVPQKVYRGAANWLDQVRKGNQGGLYEYQPGRGPSPAMTAEGFFTEQYIDFSPNSPRAAESVAYVLQHKPQWVPQNPEQTNLYYWYYATLAMHNLGGPEWEEWNRQIRDTLVKAQRTDGPFAGSWDPRTTWGAYGGRVYSTAIATLTLEVYYRFLPFYNLRLKPQDAAAGKTPNNEAGQRP